MRLRNPAPAQPATAISRNGVRIIIPGPKRPEDYSVCTRTVGPLVYSGYGYVLVHPGDIAPKDSELVKRYRRSFRQARPEDFPPAK